MEWVTPASGQQVRVVGVDALWRDTWPAKVAYQWGAAGALSLQLENGDAEPTLARLMADTSYRASLR